jgi:hypothetical protein
MQVADQQVAQKRECLQRERLHGTYQEKKRRLPEIR